MSADPATRAARRPRAVLAAVPPPEPELMPASLALLAEVLARLGSVARPVVQIIGACPETRTGPAAHAFAQAAACRFGRTLLVGSSAADTRDTPRPRRGAARAITPDALVEGLHHTHWAGEPPFAVAETIEKWLAGPTQFRLLAIESHAARLDPAALGVAAKSHGTVLAVQAGLTALADLRASIRQLTSAGATLVGTILVDAPAASARRRRLP